MKTEFLLASDTGIGRHNNEDMACAIETAPFTCHFARDSKEQGQSFLSCIAVADGMGGMDDGETASRIALSALAEEIAGGLHRASELAKVRTAARNINQVLVQKMRQENTNMGTTLTAVLLPKDASSQQAFLLHAGDSRALIFDPEENHIVQLSEDQSQSRHVLNNFIGSPFPEGQRYAFQDRGCAELQLPPCCTLLLHTDGMDQTKDSIHEILKTHKSLEEAAEKMMSQSLKKSRDNITIALWRRSKNQ